MSESRSDMPASVVPSSLGQGLVDEDARQLAAKLVNALYRLVKACQLHAETNQAVAQVTDYVVTAVAQFCTKASVGAAAILFSPHAVFVNRQMLKASRETYQLAIELGTLLEPLGVTEVTLTREISAGEVADFGRVVAEYLREGKKSSRFETGGWEGLKLRRVVGLGASHDMSPPVRAARTYAAALMILRSFYGDLRKGKYELRQGIKRVAQKLVSQTDGGTAQIGSRLLLSIAAAPPADTDRCGILLSSAIVSLAMAAQLTTDRTLLTALSSAALLYDAGRQRLIGYEQEGEPRVPRVLNVDEEALMPVSSMVALTALGKLHPPNIVRSVILHEAQAIRDGAAAYQGRRNPLLLSRILCTARTFAELRLPRQGSTPLGIDDVIQVLEAQATDNVGRALVKLLVGALGIFPAGTMVELSTGEMGVVLSTPRHPVDFARPPVRILYDTNAQLLEAPLDVDLSRSLGTGEVRRFIKRPIDATDQQMKQMRAYVMQLATNRARKKSLDKMKAVRVPDSKAIDPRSSPSQQSSGNSSGFDSYPSGASASSSHGSFGSSGSFPSAQSSSAPRSSPYTPSSAVPPSSQQSSSISSSRSAPTHRPPTRRWDPRAEDAQVQSAQRVPMAVPSPQPVGVSHETRSVSWDEYGKELAHVVRQPIPDAAGKGGEAVRPPEPLPSDTDSILAAYLAEDASLTGGPDPGQPVSQGGNNSWGLRWTGSRNNASDAIASPFAAPGRSTNSSPSREREAGASSGPARTTNSGGFAGPARITGSVERDSAGNPSNAGLRWGGSGSKSSAGGDDMQSETPDPPPIRTGGPSSDAHRAPTKQPPRTGQAATPAVPAPAGPPSLRTARTAGASAWGSPKSKRPEPDVVVEPASQELPIQPESAPAVAESPHSRRAKAGSHQWGARKDGKK